MGGDLAGGGGEDVFWRGGTVKGKGVGRRGREDWLLEHGCFLHFLIGSWNGLVPRCATTVRRSTSLFDISVVLSRRGDEPVTVFSNKPQSTAVAEIITDAWAIRGPRKGPPRVVVHETYPTTSALFVSWEREHFG